MKLSLISENIEDFIPTIVKRENITPQQALNNILACYPNGAKGKEADFIAKLWANNKIRLPEDTNRAIEAITNFKKYKLRLAIKDINQYKSITEIEVAVEPFVGTSSKSSGGLGFNPLSLPGTRLINKKGNYIVVEVTDAESLKDLGEGTKWCTRRSYNPCKADKYMELYGYICIIFNGDKPLVQYSSDYEQILDVNDDEVTDKELLKLIPVPSLVDNIDPIDISDYAAFVIKGRWPEAEPIIIKNAEAAANYAAFVIKGRWPEAESIIKNDPTASARYAINVTKKRCYNLEDDIFQERESVAEEYYEFFRDDFKRDEEAELERRTMGSNWYKNDGAW